ncbi:MAG: U32 family peptidase [Gemmataceae bacterium]|nr:U32 family peptidase [Gemmataceae bacterium]
MAGKFSLPLLNAEAATAPTWEGLRLAGELPFADDAPEPLAPQGAYATEDLSSAVAIEFADDGTRRPVELLAPAGGLDAGFAAFQFGADAIYLGLKKFSARAEAENFDLEELAEIVAFAHAQSPPRRVFVTINTLIRQDELEELIEALVALDDIGVDAVILQDLGVARALKQWFPRVELHGSTQMAVHNRAGTEVLKQLGFRRAVLARELTFEEVRDITSASGIETEVFIHGALCYSYSGLCLFSAQTIGRSGNRGKCSYSCRDSFHVEGAPMELRDGTPVKRDPTTGFPFSMKDLALPDHLPVLRAAGVSCFKIEGRKKGPTYVAAATDYYRRLIDGTLDLNDRPEAEADLQTVFSRPWTKLFIESHKDKEVADRDTVGHRGTRIGVVEQVVTVGSERRLRFRTSRELQKHDGLQIDLPTLGKPVGFAIDRLYVVTRGRAQESFEAAEGATVEIGVPNEIPELPAGAPVYCSSSQDVKQRFRVDRPKAGAFVVRRRLDVKATLTREELQIVGRCGEHESTVTTNGPFEPAQDSSRTETAFRNAFTRLGDSAFEPGEVTFRNADGLFVPVSRFNAIRRELTQALEHRLDAARRQRTEQLQAVVRPPAIAAAPSADFRWSIKVDRMAFLDAFERQDWTHVDEAIIDVARDHPTTLREKLTALADQIGRERIRLALPALTRQWEEKGLLHKIRSLRDAGWLKWEAANLSAWHYLGLDPNSAETGELDLATDWSVYVINRLAAQQVLAMGATRFALSPEDGFANSRSLWSEFGEKAVLIVHQDTPLFLAESCAYANLIGGCPGKANCTFESMEMESSHGEKATAIDYHCRTIVLNQGPYCLSPRLGELGKAGAKSLRADFIYRKYEPEVVVDRWRRIRAGKAIPGGHAANWSRGLL